MCCTWRKLYMLKNKCMTLPCKKADEITRYHWSAMLTKLGI